MRRPIPTHYAPHDDATQPALLDSGVELRAAEAIWRPSQHRTPCTGALNRLLTADQFVDNAPRREPEHVGMRIGVVANRMAACCNLADDRRGGTGPSSDQEKGGAHLVTIESVEE